MSSDLETGIAAALNGGDITSVELSELIAETEAAIPIARAVAKEARGKLLNPALPADAKARAAADQAALTADRLQAAIEPLQKRAAEVYHDEEIARWRPKYEALRDQRDALAERLREVYLPFCEQIVPVLAAIENLDVEIRMLNHHAPVEDTPYLATTEEFARGKFTGLSVVVDIKLPAWTTSSMVPVWPPNRSVDAAMITPMPATDPRAYSDRWWEVQRAAG
jgi:hypothetical protein